MDEVKSLLKDTWGFFVRHLVPICTIVLPFIIPLNLFYAFAEIYSTDKNQLFLLTMVIGLLVYPIYQASIIFYIAAAASGKNLSRDECYKLSMKPWLPLTLLSFITTAAVMAGLMLFVVPAVFVMARLAFAEFYCVLNNESPTTSFSSSWEASKEKQWVIMGGGIAILLVTVVPIWVLAEIVSLLGIDNPVFAFLLGTVESLLMVPLTIFGYRVFTLHQKMLSTKSQSDRH